MESRMKTIKERVADIMEHMKWLVENSMIQDVAEAYDVCADDLGFRSGVLFFPHMGEGDCTLLDAVEAWVQFSAMRRSLYCNAIYPPPYHDPYRHC